MIGPGKGGKDCWVSAPNPKPNVDWGALDQPIEFSDGEYIDIRKEVGLRIFVRHNNDQAIITAQFHHCACDGIGSYQFLGDVLYSYANRTGTDLAPQVELTSKRLRDRGKVSYDLNNFRLPEGRVSTDVGRSVVPFGPDQYCLEAKTEKGKLIPSAISRNSIVHVFQGRLQAAAFKGPVAGPDHQ